MAGSLDPGLTSLSLGTEHTAAATLGGDVFFVPKSSDPDMVIFYEDNTFYTDPVSGSVGYTTDTDYTSLVLDGYFVVNELATDFYDIYRVNTSRNGELLAISSYSAAFDAQFIVLGWNYDVGNYNQNSTYWSFVFNGSDDIYDVAFSPRLSGPSFYTFMAVACLSVQGNTGVTMAVFRFAPVGTDGTYAGVQLTWTTTFPVNSRDVAISPNAVYIAVHDDDSPFGEIQFYVISSTNVIAGPATVGNVAKPVIDIQWSSSTKLYVLQDDGTLSTFVFGSPTPGLFNFNADVIDLASHISANATIQGMIYNATSAKLVVWTSVDIIIIDPTDDSVVAYDFTTLFSLTPVVDPGEGGYISYINTVQISPLGYCIVTLGTEDSGLFSYGKIFIFDDTMTYVADYQHTDVLANPSDAILTPRWSP